MREIALMETLDALDENLRNCGSMLSFDSRCYMCVGNVLHEQHEHDDIVAGRVRKPQKHQSRAEREQKAREYRRWYKRTH